MWTADGLTGFGPPDCGRIGEAQSVDKTPATPPLCGPRGVVVFLILLIILRYGSVEALKTAWHHSMVTLVAFDGLHHHHHHHQSHIAVWCVTMMSFKDRSWWKFYSPRCVVTKRNNRCPRRGTRDRYDVKPNKSSFSCYERIWFFRKLDIMTMAGWIGGEGQGMTLFL